MPPIDRFGRVEDDDRLRGVWLRPQSAEYRWYAPVRLTGGGWGLRVVELRMEPDPSHRHTYWSVLARGGQVLGGDFDLPAVASWQALAAVERQLMEAVIAFDVQRG